MSATGVFAHSIELHPPSNAGGEVLSSPIFGEDWPQGLKNIEGGAL